MKQIFIGLALACMLVPAMLLAQSDEKKELVGVWKVTELRVGQSPTPLLSLSIFDADGSFSTAGGYKGNLIRAARGAAGKDLQVMVDYNQSLSVPEAIGRVQLLERWSGWKNRLEPMISPVMPESQQSAALPFRSAKTCGGRTTLQREVLQLCRSALIS